MFIFLDGPDGGGKTTLAKLISEMYGFPIHHFSYPKSEAEKKQMFEMYADFIHNHNNVIVDRCWYAEMIYGRIMREGSNITYSQMYELERLVISQGGGMIVHCTDNMKNLWRRFKGRGDDYISQDFSLLSGLKKDYEYLMHKVPHLLPVFRYGINEKMPRL